MRDTHSRIRSIKPQLVPHPSGLCQSLLSHTDNTPPSLWVLALAVMCSSPTQGPKSCSFGPPCCTDGRTYWQGTAAQFIFTPHISRTCNTQHFQMVGQWRDRLTVSKQHNVLNGMDTTSSKACPFQTQSVEAFQMILGKRQSGQSDHFVDTAG